MQAVEEAYEFFLAFAAQGLTDDRSSTASSELRRFLERMDEALGHLGPGFRSVVGNGSVHAPERILPMIEVLERDAAAARAAVGAVSSRESISSQLVDNLNASIHVRALLTDIFLVDEAIGDS